MSYLITWGLLESKTKKMYKNIKILPNSMAFRTKKDFKAKNVSRNKVYILAKDVKAKTNSA